MRKARGGGDGEASQTKNREAPLFFSIPTPTRSSLSFALASSSLVMNDQIKIRRENRGLWTVYYETDKSFRKIGPSENNPAVNGFWANSSLPLIFYITLLFPDFQLLEIETTVGKLGQTVFSVFTVCASLV